MAAFSDGAIVGSAIVRIVAEHGTDCVAICKRVCEEDESGCGGSVKDRDKAIK